MERERRRDRLGRFLFVAGVAIVLGPPFVVVCWLALDGLRGGR